MADFGDFAGGAISGASMGAALGPWGAAGGAVIGGLLGTFGGGSSNTTPTYTNPFEGAMADQAVEDSRSHLGADMATHAAADIEENAREQERVFQNDPDFVGNAAVQSAFYNKSRGQAESNMIDANLKGAETDQATHETAFGEIGQLNTFDYNKYLNDVKEQQKPSFFDSLAQQGMSSLTGGFLGTVGQRLGSGWYKNGHGANPSYDVQTPK